MNRHQGGASPPTSRPRRLIRSAVRRMREPAALAIVAVVCFVSAAGQALLHDYAGSDSWLGTAVLSVLGSAALTMAIILAARRSETQPPSRDDAGQGGERSR